MENWTKLLYSVVRFSYSDQILTNKADREKIAKRQLSMEIGRIINSEMHRLPVTLFDSRIDSLDLAEEYKLEVCLVDFRELGKLREKAEKWDLIEFAIDNEIEFVQNPDTGELLCLTRKELAYLNKTVKGFDGND